ncbi:hypothetical protein SKAU_G00119960 [Synaphobranchus kaupii]|uniref:Uncharacterized protein n=1 Tax=Synaphobranchus kaupii TaxID=118154 RepID=A0A9Q1FNY2_SYNKA|nr:hypothetical protein SKAU_G00119960 [Synaphobranchus kaupii]
MPPPRRASQTPVAVKWSGKAEGRTPEPDRTAGCEAKSGGDSPTRTGVASVPARRPSLGLPYLGHSWRVETGCHDSRGAWAEREEGCPASVPGSTRAWPFRAPAFRARAVPSPGLMNATANVTVRSAKTTPPGRRSLTPSVTQCKPCAISPAHLLLPLPAIAPQLRRIRGALPEQPQLNCQIASSAVTGPSPI